MHVITKVGLFYIPGDIIIVVLVVDFPIITVAGNNQKLFVCVLCFL